jgi:hypothetical protein
MLILKSKSLATLCVLAGAWFLAGCTSMSADECAATDWRTVGYEDGVAGHSGDRVGKYRKACGKHGMTPDLAEYQGGREQGLREFCKPLNGFRVGASGASYGGVCPAELDAPFLEAYESGRQLHNLETQVSYTASSISSMQAESDRIDADLVRVGALILDKTTTNEQRAQLLVDSKHMAERKGEIKARLPQLESDLKMQQRELADYRASLRYVE